MEVELELAAHSPAPKSVSATLLHFERDVDQTVPTLKGNKVDERNRDKHSSEQPVFSKNALANCDFPVTGNRSKKQADMMKFNSRTK